MNKAGAKLLMMILIIVVVVQGRVWAKDLDRGELEYRSRCGVCHGVNAKGDGPLATQLKTSPTDLTQLARRNGGIFPEDSVKETIDGRKEVEAHGPRDMPVWGYRYVHGNDVGQRTRQQALLDYLRRVQEK